MFYKEVENHCQYQIFAKLLCFNLSTPFPGPLLLQEFLLVF
jgi:hypothetical protein